jgi:integrase
MARTRQYQAGYIFKKGLIWYVRYREDVQLENGSIARVQKCRKLAEARGKYQTKSAVRELAQEILRQLNDGTLKPESTMSLNRFIEGIYLPYVSEQRRRSTYCGYKNVWQRYVKPDGETALRDFKTLEGEQMLQAIARREDLNRKTLAHIKHLLSGVFRYALRLGVLSSQNPMRDVEIPKARPAGETYAYSLEEETRMLALLPEPAATVVATAAFTGVRKGELRALAWENYNGSEIRVKSSMWRSHLEEPKRPKSKGPIPVIEPLRILLERHWVRCGRPDRGFIFSNERHEPMNLEAMALDVIRPILQNANLPWYGWHAFRRGLATNLHGLGVSDRVIQEILRHANVTTTMNIYVKIVSADAVTAMKTLEAICATTVQPEVLTKLVSEIEATHGKSRSQKQLGELAERGGFEPPVGVLAPTTV